MGCVFGALAVGFIAGLQIIGLPNKYYKAYLFGNYRLSHIKDEYFENTELGLVGDKIIE